MRERERGWKPCQDQTAVSGFNVFYNVSCKRSSHISSQTVTNHVSQRQNNPTVTPHVGGEIITYRTQLTKKVFNFFL